MLLFLALLPVIPAESYWMTAVLLRVDWREGCLTTAGCSKPRFKILKDMLTFEGKISISWPVSENLVPESSRPFASHWTKGPKKFGTLMPSGWNRSDLWLPTYLRSDCLDPRFRRHASGRNRRHQHITKTLQCRKRSWAKSWLRIEPSASMSPWLSKSTQRDVHGALIHQK
ncbi:unnamed protein product [Cylicocyclus nassatus]|uniref:C2 domain-containing protein n=1 Tax=Cylicocyclus nassatus TaxID=53992 RepID=A0AA36H0K4_CYLNA|nr:unnamed protein product [Cylicocyclus nassatus]